MVPPIEQEEPMSSTNINALPAHAETFSRPASQVTDFIKPILERTSAWIMTCADYMAAAAMYEQLSYLSDAELHRRGLSRATLARDVLPTGGKP
jgi:hypothetical protein